MAEIENEFKGCQKSKVMSEAKSQDLDQDEEDRDTPLEITPGTKLVFYDQFKSRIPKNYWGMPLGHKADRELKYSKNGQIMW